MHNSLIKLQELTGLSLKTLGVYKGNSFSVFMILYVLSEPSLNSVEEDIITDFARFVFAGANRRTMDDVLLNKPSMLSSRLRTWQERYIKIWNITRRNKDK